MQRRFEYQNNGQPLSTSDEEQKQVEDSDSSMEVVSLPQRESV